MHRKFFNDCVVNLLKNQLSAKFYKKLLIKLPEKILPKMSNPLMLSDFLTQSYNSGGLISVLALNSLFVLITSFNLEYPNFFQKVYQLLDSSIFSTKYKDRFFQHLDNFLLSTHLSSTLVGAFIKKLSRMLLTCPPGDARFLILFIYNLLIRHKNCKVLIHRATKKKDGNEMTSMKRFWAFYLIKGLIFARFFFKVIRSMSIVLTIQSATLWKVLYGSFSPWKIITWVMFQRKLISWIAWILMKSIR